MNNKKKIQQFYLLSFALPLLATLILFIVDGIYPFGGTTFLRKDFYQQYTPFFYEFYRKMKNGESLYYSWNAGIGANFLAVYVYYLASPFNFLSLLIPEKFILEFMTYMVVLKTGFMGLTMSHYLRRHFDRTDLAMTVFGLAYALSGFMAAYNWNVMWMDVLFATPLVILGLEYIHAGKKPYLYCIALAFSIYSNYYLSIMLCMFLVLYYIALTVMNGFRLSGFIRFGWYSLLSGAFGAVLMLPELAALQFTSFTSSKFPKDIEFYMKPVDIFGRHLAGVTTETGLDHWPNIYCGIFTIFLVALYFATRQVRLKEKIVKLVLVLFFLLSYDLKQLNYIWHGFNYPDSLPARQTYLYIILLLVMAYEGFTHLRDSGKKAYIASLAVSTIAIVVTLIFDKDDALDVSTIWINAACIIACLGFFTIHRLDKTKTQKYSFTRAIICLFMVVELCVNMGITNGHSIKRKDYFSSFAAYRELNKTVKASNVEKNNPLGRVDEIKRKIRNNSMLIDFSSLSCFSSTTNGLIQKYCERYGLTGSRVFYLNEGVTPVSSAFMGQHFTMIPAGSTWNSRDLGVQIDENDGAKLYSLNTTLPAGYVIRGGDTDQLFASVDTCKDILSKKIKGFGYGSNPLEIENSLINALGIEDRAFSYLKRLEDKGKTAEYTTTEDGHYYLYDNKKTTEDLKVTFDDGSDALTYSSRRYKYVLDLGYHAEGTKVTFTSDKNAETDFDICVYKMNSDIIEKFSSLINSNEKLENIVQDDVSLSGTIDMAEDGHLCLQVPYEKGWTLYVDGEETPIETFDSLYISTPLQKGLHTIEIRFYPEGLKSGMMITLLAALLIAVSFIIEKKNRAL